MGPGSTKLHVGQWERCWHHFSTIKFSTLQHSPARLSQPVMTFDTFQMTLMTSRHWHWYTYKSSKTSSTTRIEGDQLMQEMLEACSVSGWDDVLEMQGVWVFAQPSALKMMGWEESKPLPGWPGAGYGWQLTKGSVAFSELFCIKLGSALFYVTPKYVCVEVNSLCLNHVV